MDLRAVQEVVWVGIGGAAGAASRYGVVTLCQRLWPGFPWGTWVVNLVGCFVIGVFLALGVTQRESWERALLCTGFLGALTTMSAWSAETLALAQRGDRWQALAYSGGTMVTCLAAAWLGMLVAGAFGRGHAAPFDG